MPNQTVKNGLKAKKIKLPQMNFFLEKQLIKFSCTYWPLSFCKILKKFLGLIQSYEDVPICHEQFFLVQTIIITFIYLLALFIVQIFIKKIAVDPELWGCIILGPKWSTCPKRKIFWKKLSILFSSTNHPLSLCKIFKKILQQIQINNVAHLPKWEIFQKTC